MRNVFTQGFKYHSVEYWHKYGVHTQSGARRTGRIETIIVATNADKKEFLFNDVDKGTIVRSNVYTIPVDTLYKDSTDGSVVNIAQKPVPLWMTLIDTHSTPDSEVGLLCEGSHSGVVACASLGRSCSAWEVDQKQCRAGHERVQQFIHDATTDATDVCSPFLSAYYATVYVPLTRDYVPLPIAYFPPKAAPKDAPSVDLMTKSSKLKKSSAARPGAKKTKGKAAGDKEDSNTFTEEELQAASEMLAQDHGDKLGTSTV